MSLRQSKMFVIAFVATLALLAAAGSTAIINHDYNTSVCQCEGG